MNTHDIELPPLPKASKMYDIPGYDEEELKAYARAAIEADRKRRGEPWMPVESCPGGNGVRYLFVRDCGQGTLPAVEMGYMLDADTEVYMDSTHEPFTKYGYRVTHWTHLPGLPNTPQPAEPCESSVSNKTACGSENGNCDSQPAEQVKQEPVGEACAMPGAPLFTMASFLASDVPPGSKLYVAPQPAEPGGYVHTAPDDCETLHWRGQILSLNELATISAEPVKVPSDEEIRSLAKNHMLAHAQFVGAGEVWYEGEVEFARALLARYGSTTGEATKQRR